MYPNNHLLLLNKTLKSAVCCTLTKVERYSGESVRVGVDFFIITGQYIWLSKKDPSALQLLLLLLKSFCEVFI